MNDSELDEILEKMLRKNALKNQMLIEKDFAKLVESVRYLHTQLKLTKRFCEKEGGNHIEEVILASKGILSEN